MRKPAPSATRRAYESVRSRILDGSLPGGRLISEGEIAAELGLSRTPVRAAFQQLAGEDLLTLYPKRGALVATMTPAGVHDVLVACSVVEPWAAARAAGDPEHAGHGRVLHGAADAVARALDDDAPAAFQNADRDFHERFVSYCRSPLLVAFHATLRHRMLRGATLAVALRPARPAEIIGEHAAIADAIGDGDGPAAADAVRVHLRATARALGVPSDL